MSTQQPPEGSGYAQPQDPWEGSFEPGLASVPTDPIPEQRYEPAFIELCRELKLGLVELGRGS